MENIDNELKLRIKKGYDYFWNLKPSEFKPKDIIWLHQWLKLLAMTRLDLTNDPEKPIENLEDLYNICRGIFG